jgi:heme exporter protein B
LNKHKEWAPAFAGATANIFVTILRRDLTNNLRRAGQTLTAPLFFILAAALFPLGLSPDPALLQQAAPGVLAMAGLFAALLAVDRLFTDDARDGTLDILTATGAPLALYAAGRLAAVWVFVFLPLLTVSPLMGLMLGLTFKASLLVPLILLPASALLLLTGALAAALAEGARQGAVLLALLAMPLYSPVLIFSAGAIDLARTGGGFATPLILLWAMLALALPAAPIACGAILRGRIKS